MVRGTPTSIGERRVSQNGYDYTRCENGWVLTHRLIAEQKLGRPLGEDERVAFVDGDRTNLDPNNVTVSTKRTTSIKRQIAKNKVKIQELRAKNAILEQQLKLAS
jgi:hypothetical protein